MIYLPCWFCFSQMKRLVDLRFILKELTRSHPRIIIRDSHTHKACHPKNFTDYDTIKHEFKFPQISGHFNFAEDVLDKWAEKEKVTFYFYSKQCVGVCVCVCVCVCGYDSEKHCKSIWFKVRNRLITNSYLCYYCYKYILQNFCCHN